MYQLIYKVWTEIYVLIFYLNIYREKYYRSFFNVYDTKGFRNF